MGGPKVQLMVICSQRVLASTSEYTIVSFIIGSQNDILMGRANLYVPNGGQEDFQVIAQTGYLVPDYGGHIIPTPLGYNLVSFGDSGWSDVHSITYKFGLLGDYLYSRGNVATILAPYTRLSCGFFWP